MDSLYTVHTYIDACIIKAYNTVVKWHTNTQHMYTMRLSTELTEK